MVRPAPPAGSSQALRRGALAGIVAIAAWIAVTPLDQRLLRSRYDDVQVLGMAFTRAPAWLPLGLAFHAMNGVVFGLLYARFAAARLPGPPWLRGLLAASAESAILSTLTPLVDRLHPAVRDGATGRMSTLPALLQAAIRHAVFGTVLGAVYGR